MSKKKKRKERHIKNIEFYKRVEKHNQKVLENTLGAIIDLPFDEFKEKIVNDKTNVGMCMSLSKMLSGVYSNFVKMKDDLLKMRSETEELSVKQECEFNIQRIYIILERIEEKVVFLKERAQKLMDETAES